MSRSNGFDLFQDKIMKAVKFAQSHPPYQVGEVAGFEDEVADKLVADGIAEAVEESEAKAVDVPEKTKQVRSRKTK